MRTEVGDGHNKDWDCMAKADITKGVLGHRLLLKVCTLIRGWSLGHWPNSCTNCQFGWNELNIWGILHMLKQALTLALSDFHWGLWSRLMPRVKAVLCHHQMTNQLRFMRRALGVLKQSWSKYMLERCWQSDRYSHLETLHHCSQILDEERGWDNTSETIHNHISFWN